VEYIKRHIVGYHMQSILQMMFRGEAGSLEEATATTKKYSLKIHAETCEIVK